MLTIGKTLREAREARGYTLEHVQEVTKIQKRYLLAIEEEDFDIMPGHFYTRAFIRQYAEVLGADAEALVTIFDEASERDRQAQLTAEEAEEVLQARHLRAKEKKPNVLRHINWTVIGLLVACVGIVTAIIWAAMSLDKESQPAQQATQSSESGQSLVASDAHSSSVSATSSSVQQQEIKLQGKQTSFDTWVYQVNEHAVSDTLRIASHGETWVQVVIDDEELFAGTLLDEDQQQFTIPRGTQEVAIRIGNVPDTSVWIGQRALVLADDGETQTVLIQWEN